jgi:hypothetical protein
MKRKEKEENRMNALFVYLFVFPSSSTFVDGVFFAFVKPLSSFFQTGGKKKVSDGEHSQRLYVNNHRTLKKKMRRKEWRDQSSRARPHSQQEREGAKYNK